MKFIETKLQGAYIVELDLLEDERGFFARSWCQKEFSERGLNPNLVQCNLSFNRHKGTLRGLHYQIHPHAEAKLLWCTRGAIYDVIIDIRPDSSTFKQWVGVELSVENRRMFYIPEGFAHGFQTLQDNTDLFYQMSEFYYPQSARGIRWDDPLFEIEWPPDECRTISPRDQSFPDFQP